MTSELGAGYLMCVRVEIVSAVYHEAARYLMRVRVEIVSAR